MVAFAAVVVIVIVTSGAATATLLADDSLSRNTGLYTRLQYSSATKLSASQFAPSAHFTAENFDYTSKRFRNDKQQLLL